MKQGLFYGIKDLYFIWNGTDRDPQIEYQGKRYNYYQIENDLWISFKEYCQETGLDPETDENFRQYVQEQADYIKNDLIFILDGGEL